MPKAYEMLKKTGEQDIAPENIQNIQSRARQLIREFHPDKASLKSLNEIKNQVKNYPLLDQFLSLEMKKINIENPEMEKAIYIKILSEAASIIHDACDSRGKKHSPDEILFEDIVLPKDFNREFQELYKESIKRETQTFEEKIKPHLDNHNAIITPENKIYYIYLDRFSDGNRNLARDSKSDLFDSSNNTEFRSKLGKKLYDNEGILVFETFEQALHASGKIRDHFSGNDKEDAILQCSLPPIVLAKATSVTTNNGKILSDQDGIHAYVFKTPPLGSAFFSLGNISAVFTVDVLKHVESTLDEEEAENFKRQLKADAIKNNYFPILEQSIPTPAPNVDAKFEALANYLRETCDALKSGQEWKELNQIQNEIKKNKVMTQNKLNELITRIEMAFQPETAPKKKGLGLLFSKKTSGTQPQRSDVISAKNTFDKLKEDIFDFTSNKPML